MDINQETATHVMLIILTLVYFVDLVIRVQRSDTQRKTSEFYRMADKWADSNLPWNYKQILNSMRNYNEKALSDKFSAELREALQVIVPDARNYRVAQVALQYSRGEISEADFRKKLHILHATVEEALKLCCSEDDLDKSTRDLGYTAFVQASDIPPVVGVKL